MKDKIRKLIRESINILFEEKKEKSKFEKFIDNPSDEIKSIETVEEMNKLLFDMTCGFHFPFNPPEPLRTDFRNKIEELKEKNPEEFENSNLDMVYSRVAGEYEPTPPLPPGAVY